MKVARVVHGLPVQAVTESYRSDILVFNRWLNGRPLSQETVLSYFADAETRYKISSVARKKCSIKKAVLSACKTLADKAQVEAYFREIKTGQVEASVHEHEILTRDELSKITAKAGRKTAALISGLYESAARVSEFLSLRLSDCEVRNGKVFCLIRRGKRKKSRTAFMSKETFENLKKLYAGKTYLVERNGKQISRQGVAKLIKHAGELIGRTDIHPHTLRHCAATHLLTSGESLPAVAAYCGHADSAVTAKFYLHSKPSADAVLKILGAL